MKSKVYDQERKRKLSDDDHDGSITFAAAEDASEKAAKADSTRRTILSKFIRLIPFFLKGEQPKYKFIGAYDNVLRTVAATANVVKFV